MYSITCDAKKYLNEINFSTDNISENSKSAEKAKQIKTQAKTKNINELKERWKDKSLHGKYPIRATDPDVNSSLTHQNIFVGSEIWNWVLHHSGTGPEPTNEKFSS